MSCFLIFSSFQKSKLFLVYFNMLVENFINNIILLIFFIAAFSAGRLIFHNILFSLAIGISILSLLIYTIFLVFGINILTVIFIYAVEVSITIIVIAKKRSEIFNLRINNEYLSLKKLLRFEFLITFILLLIYFVKCSFPLADGDSLGHYSYLSKLYISNGNFSVGNFLYHGKIPLLHSSLISFLSYFGSLDIASVFNFYLLVLIIAGLYKTCSSFRIEDKIDYGRVNSNSFGLIICIFLANPLMNFIISTGRPYILTAYLCTAIIYFLLLNVNKNHEKLFILFLGLVGGALISINQLGLAIFGCFVIALFIANYKTLKSSSKSIICGGIIVSLYSLPFYLRTFSLTGKFLYLPPSLKLGVNEFTGLLGPIKAMFVLSVRHNQGGNSCCIGILFLSFLPILLYLTIKKRLWRFKPLLFLFTFITLYYFVWLTKIPQARSLIGVFPPYLFLLYLLVDLKKPLYKYAIYLFSCIILLYCFFQLHRFDYDGYLFSSKTKADFVYNILRKWRNDNYTFEEENEIVNYIHLTFPNYDVIFSDEVFPLTLLNNRIIRLGSKKQRDKAILLSNNSTPQNFERIKQFKTYTIYEYK